MPPNRRLPRVPTFGSRFKKRRRPFGGGGGNFSFSDLPPGGAEPPAQPEEEAPGWWSDTEVPYNPSPSAFNNVPGEPTETDREVPEGEETGAEMVPASGEETEPVGEPGVPGPVAEAPTETEGEAVPFEDVPPEEDEGVPTEVEGPDEAPDPSDPDIALDVEEEIERQREEEEKTPEEQEAESKRRLDEEFQALLEEHEGGWGNIEDQLQSDTAEHMRRIAEINAQLGRSVGGGFGGAYGQVALGSIEAMANAKAKHETEKRNLQLAWMEKSIDQDFQREMSASDQAMSMITALLESGEPIDEETMDFLFSQIGGGMGGGMPSQWRDRSRVDSDDDGIPDMEETARGSDPDDAESMPEEGSVWTNEEGDLYYGVGEEGDSQLGTPGEMASDPHDDEGEEHQWFASGSGAPWERTYYHMDDDGNRVEFVPGEDGGRYPGDPSYYANNDYKFEHEENAEGYVEWSTPGSDRVILAHEIFDQLANAMGVIFGSDYAGTVDIDADNHHYSDLEFENEGAEARWYQVMDAGGDMLAGGANVGGFSQGGFLEITSFMLAYMDDHDGAKPSSQELADHLEKLGWVDL